MKRPIRKSVSKRESTEQVQDQKSYAEHWADLFLEQFTRESDRAAVIVTASIFDDALLSLLKQYLVPNASSNDELFDGMNAPLSSFSAKISLAYRLGLISGPFARNLNLVRRIRNEFAHNIKGGSFDDSAVKGRVMELYRSQVFRTDEGYLNGQTGPRGDFLLVCSWMLWSLQNRVERTSPLREAALEFGFTETKTASSAVDAQQGDESDAGERAASSSVGGSAG